MGFANVTPATFLQAPFIKTLAPEKALAIYQLLTHSEMSKLLSTLKHEPSTIYAAVRDEVGTDLQDASPFLHVLPTEVRVQIYENLPLQPMLSELCTRRHPISPYSLHPAILPVCKVIHREAEEVLYESNTFSMNCGLEHYASRSCMLHSPLTRYHNLLGVNRFDAHHRELTQLTCIHKVWKWRIFMATRAGRYFLDPFVDFIQVISSNDDLSLEISILPSDDKLGNQVATIPAIVRLLMTLRNIKNVSFTLGALSDHQQRALITFEDRDPPTEWFQLETASKTDIQLRVKDTEPAEFPHKMYLSLLAYVQSYERSKGLRDRVSLEITHSDYWDNCKPLRCYPGSVESRLYRAFRATRTGDLIAFKKIRAKIVLQQEQIYQKIRKAAQEIRQWIRATHFQDGFSILEASSITRTMNISRSLACLLSC